MVRTTWPQIAVKLRNKACSWATHSLQDSRASRECWKMAAFLLSLFQTNQTTGLQQRPKKCVVCADGCLCQTKITGTSKGLLSGCRPHNPKWSVDTSLKFQFYVYADEYLDLVPLFKSLPPLKIRRASANQNIDWVCRAWFTIDICHSSDSTKRSQPIQLKHFTFFIKGSQVLPTDILVDVRSNCAGDLTLFHEIRSQMLALNYKVIKTRRRRVSV